MRVGVFGGTFNPPHEGHKKLALEFMSRLSLDLMLVIPTYQPPHKEADSLATAEDRLEMCRLCFGALSERIIVSDTEIKRHGRSYTVETLDNIKKEHPDYELFFLMGSDMLLTFSQWKNPDKILDLAVICAASRDKVGADFLRNYVKAQYPQRKERFIILDFSPVEVSSTQLRNELPNCVCELPIDKSVETYIKERGLYR